MQLKCFECGWLGSEKEAIHLNDEEQSALKDILYKDVFQFGKYHIIKHYKEFLLYGGHICPKCSSRIVLDISLHEVRSDNNNLNLLRNYG